MSTQMYSSHYIITEHSPKSEHINKSMHQNEEMNKIIGQHDYFWGTYTHTHRHAHTHTCTCTHTHTHTHTKNMCTCVHSAYRHTYVYMSSVVIQMNGICVCSLKERQREIQRLTEKHREWKKQKGRETEQRMWQDILTLGEREQQRHTEKHRESR